MRRLIKLAITLALLLFFFHNNVLAAEIMEPVKVRCTCYCYNSGITAAGTIPKQGLTVAGKSEWIGKACVLYRINEDESIGDLIGIYEFLDTGGDLIESGKRIDVFRNTLDECYEWVGEYGDYVYFQVIDAKG